MTFDEPADVLPIEAVEKERLGGPVVPATHVRGQGGEQLFGYLLSKLGFGEASNLRDDMGNGIDSFVFVRRPLDASRSHFVELGVIAAQVKTGPSWFDSPTDGAVTQ